jgi:hypothetical protein
MAFYAAAEQFLARQWGGMAELASEEEATRIVALKA